MAKIHPINRRICNARLSSLSSSDPVKLESVTLHKNNFAGMGFNCYMSDVKVR